MVKEKISNNVKSKDIVDKKYKTSSKLVDITNSDLISNNSNPSYYSNEDDTEIITNKELDKIIKSTEKKSKNKIIDYDDFLDSVKYIDLNDDQFDTIRDRFLNDGYKFLDDDVDIDEPITDEDIEPLIEDEDSKDNGEDSEFEEENNNEDADKPNLIENNDVKVQDSIKLYLNEIGKFKLLTADEEKELALKVAQGDENARHKLTNSNLRLVVNIAKHYIGRGMQFLDLIEEGNIGLMKAVEKFDSNKGYKFSTYATCWIKQAISRAIGDQARTVRIPIHMVDNINKVNKATRKLTVELARNPTPEEISKEIGGSMTPKKVIELQKMSQEPISLQSKIGDEEESRLEDFVEDKESLSPSQYTNRELNKENLYKIMGDLTEKERQILILLYGLEDGVPRTLEEVGKIYGVSRERIRQIKAKAIRKLKNPAKIKNLDDDYSNY